jgi:hypothetical protein
MKCRYCEKRETSHDKRICELCEAYDLYQYHKRSLVQVKHWKREIFTDTEFDIDGLIGYHAYWKDQFLQLFNFIRSLDA